MKQSEIEDKFIDYIEQTLTQAESDEITRELAQNKNLRSSFEAYKQLIAIEKTIADTAPQTNSFFTSKIMNEIREKEVGFIRKLYMEFSNRQKLVFGAVATLATLILVVKTSDIGSNYDLKHPAKTVAGQGSKSELIEDVKVALKQDIENIKKNNPSQDLRNLRAPGEGKSADNLKAPASFKPKPAQALKNLEEIDKSEVSKITVPSSVSVADAAIGNPTDGRDRETRSEVKTDYAAAVIPNSEDYRHYIENSRLLVSEQPSSTFSIDVDTASYTNARRFLKEGQLPPKDAIRVEEFINYFDYNYPVQHQQPFTLSYEIAPSPLEQDRYLLKLGIKAKDASEEIKPWNLVFLVDTSGSMMDSNKLPLVKQSLKILVEKMRASDKIGIVTYAGTAGVALESSSIKDKSKILAAIDSLSSGGSTNGSGGIHAAYDLAAKNNITNGVNRVVLATDGDFNVGVTSHEELIQLIENKRKTGIALTGLGYGRGNIKDGTLEQLANKGNGNYFYIDSFQEARKVLETDLLGNMEVVAKDVKLQIEFNPERISSYRLVGYENRKLNREDFNNDAIDAGEIGTGHTVTAIYEVVLTNSALAKTLQDEYRYQKKQEPTQSEAGKKELSSELAFLKIRYKQPDANESKLLQFPIESKDLKSKVEEATNDFKFASAVSYFGQILRGSQFVGKYSLKEVQSLAEASRGEDKKGYRQEFIELIKNAQALGEHKAK